MVCECICDCLYVCVSVSVIVCTYMHWFRRENKKV